jgi:WD40 repeat protein
MRERISIVALSGGLGNQLFQLFAAHHFSAGAQILVESDSHKPQRDFKHNLVVDEFTILRDINSINAAAFPIFIQRIASLNLRSNLNENRGFARWIRRLSSRILLSIFLTLRYKSFFKLLTPTTVDEFPIFDGARNVFLNGYFQNSLSVSSSSSKKLINAISLNKPDDEIQSWLLKAEEISPVILHYRLGDYRAHPDMGVLDPSYFIKAIAEIRASRPDAEVWVFSDEPRIAYDLLLATGISQLREIPEFSPGETLELMRHGSAYVISNSTFSWWGAVLKYDGSAEVWAPRPWFKSQKSPEGIYGENWHLVDAWNDLPSVEPIEELEE